MIKVQNLSKIYGDHIAVDDISFEVKEGHIYGFLGPNGAGKSTTMNIITGYLAPTSGTVEVNGYVMGKDTLKAKKSIGYLPEIPPLYVDMNVKEYLTFVAKIKGVPKNEREAEIEKVMSATDITDMSKRLIKHLSKGYKQRVGIAQAILGDPEIVILDEPTVGLDPEQIIEIRTLIKSLKGDHTVILSSHILSEISATCDEVLVIANGRMVACDTTENLLKNGKSVKTLNLNIKGEKDKIEKVLSNIEELDEVEFVEDKGESCLFKVSCDPSKDVREVISFALSDARLLILEMSEETSSLEDIYLTLVKEADEQYEAEMQAIRDGVDLDEVFDEDKTDEESEDGTDEKSDDDASSDTEEEGSENDSKEDEK
ncbi:MAG: ATP-binding cassette domain-containing protein [Lachnospiraceae bacterium]|nr:ATP-binding cassette domain-containing protein [Lachnospiraceae bacterium]